MALSSALVVARQAEAETVEFDNIHLAYSAPDNCGSQRQIFAKLHEALGSSSEPVPNLIATIRVSTENSHLVLTYRAQLGATESQRSLVLDDCEAVVEASALLLLLTLDPTLAQSIGAPGLIAKNVDAVAPTPNAAASVPGQASTGRRSAADNPVSAPHTDEPARALSRTSPLIEGGWIAVGGSLASALTPGVSLGGGLDVGVRAAALRLGVQAGWSTAPQIELHTSSNASLRTSLWRIHGAAAVEFGSRPFLYGPEVRLGLEQIRAETKGVVPSRAGSTNVLVATAGIWMNTYISKNWGIGARTSLLMPLERPRFWVAGEPVHRPDWLGGEIFLGIFWAWASQ